MIVRQKTTDVNIDCNIAYIDLCTTHNEGFSVGGVSKNKYFI